MKVETTPGFEKDMLRLFSDKPQYKLLRFWKWITSDLWSGLKWKLQRAQRGYSDNDVWGMNSYFAEIIPPMVRQMKEKGFGYPGHGRANTPEKWGAILEEIAQGFEAFDGEIGKLGDEEKFNKGMKLFVRWFNNLWD